MKKLALPLLVLISFISGNAQVNNDEEYITFNDRNNKVHGVYLGLGAHYGELSGKAAYGGSFKIAYVANQRFEIGLAITGFESDQPLIADSEIDHIVTAGTVGIHLEPIMFSDKRVSLSFPLVVGAGVAGYRILSGPDFDEDFQNTELEDYNAVFLIEPGVSTLFNLSRYIQLEAGIKYRLTGKLNLATSPIERLNGFTAGIGLKVGVFNMGRNRYKKKLD
ncbi:hypothetical protein [Maribacter sp. Asnod1-A12]|uniref:hypothetical protein n=1 Tax=Maribacter sp. Asnod1-A12 TaxID=3160576 RepID=UPI00386FFA97